MINNAFYIIYSPKMVDMNSRRDEEALIIENKANKMLKLLYK